MELVLDLSPGARHLAAQCHRREETVVTTQKTRAGKAEGSRWNENLVQEMKSMQNVDKSWNVVNLSDAKWDENMDLEWWINSRWRWPRASSANKGKETEQTLVLWRNTHALPDCQRTLPEDHGFGRSERS